MKDQLCYQLNISAIEGLAKSDLGQDKGLALLIDLGDKKEKSVKQIESPLQLGWGNHYESRRVLFNPEYEEKLQDSWSAKLYIDTLKGRQIFLERSQTIALDSLKRSLVTKDFLDLNAEDRKCNPERTNDCRNRLFMEKIWDNCKCTAFTMLTSSREQVVSTIIRSPNHVILFVAA